MIKKTQIKMSVFLLLGLYLGCTENNSQLGDTKPFHCMSFEESGMTTDELRELFNYTDEDVLKIAEGERVGRCSGELVESGDFTVNVQRLEGETYYSVAVAVKKGYQVTKDDHASCAVVGVPAEVVVQSSIEEYNLTVPNIAVGGTELLDDWADKQSMNKPPGGVPLIGTVIYVSGKEVNYHFALPADGTLWLSISNDGSENSFKFQKCDSVENTNK